MKKRLVLPELGVYQDFRAVLHIPGAAPEAIQAAKADDVEIVLQTGQVSAAQTGLRNGILFLGGFPPPGQEWELLAGVPEPASPPEPHVAAEIRRAMNDPKEWKKLLAKMKNYPDEAFAAAAAAVPEFPAKWDSGLGQSQQTPFAPYELSFRHASIHVLARELSETAIRDALAAGRLYAARDWLCEPSHLSLVAVNELGVFDIGDRIPFTRRTYLEAHLSASANLKVIRDGETVFKTQDEHLRYPVTRPGDYRLEASIAIDGEDLPWIATNPLHILQPQTELLPQPPTTIAVNVQVFPNLSYASGAAENAGAHTLDLYIPKDRKKFPVLLFFPAELWRADRAAYAAIGNRFAKDGIGVAIASYRFPPDHPWPAQIEDAAAAFAWVSKFIAGYGGDPQRIYLAGHSSGGRLASLLALDPSFLRPYGFSPSDIKGVASISGLYDASEIAVLNPDSASKRGAPPSLRIRPTSPPFLIVYCQWDYPALPYRARQLYSSLRKSFVSANLLYVPGENHLSEVLSMWRDDDPIAQAILKLVHPAP